MAPKNEIAIGLRWIPKDTNTKQNKITEAKR